MSAEEKMTVLDSSSETKGAETMSEKADETTPISIDTGISLEEKIAMSDSASETKSEEQMSDKPAETPPTPSQHDIDLLTKLEEANRQLQIIPPATPLPKTPLELELLEKLDAANRLLEADKKLCKGLTPTHSRSGSNVGPVNSSPQLGHSRKGSSTSNVSENSAGHNHEEETASPGGNIWEIWGKLVNDWGSAKKKPAFIKQLVRKGIPNPFRCLAWQLILEVNHSPMKESYVEYLKQKSPSEKMIRRDIARTFPEHDFFKEKNGVGQESLFNVMKAYSLHDREVGYCQGSGFIVGLLLMQMPEEEAFAVLVKLMQDYRLRELFKPSMAELGLCMYKLECLIQELLPDLYTHFQTQSFHTSMYASSWFLTLFATVVPLSVACRVMDLFISEGMDVIFRIGIAILQSSHTELMSMDMEGMLHFFQKEISVMFEKDEDSLFNVAYHVRISVKKFKRLEKEYTALKTKQNEDQIELRRLRTENRLLRQRIDNLEKESSTLADRLIQYQLTRAQEAEETYALKNELSLTKQKYSESKKQLDQAASLLDDIKERTDSINSASTLDDSEAQVAVQSLQEELITVRLKEAENSSTIKQLHHKIDDLEQFNLRLQKAPSNDVQCLQEELIAVKLREAEANLSMKEMRQTISDLDVMWQRHLEDSDSLSSPKDKSNNNKVKNELKKTQEELMSVKLREAAALSHLKDTKQKVMELETSNQICSNQIRRMDEENKKLKSDLEEGAKQEAEAQRQIKALLRKLDDLESKRKEEMMMARIREAENDQVVCELKQKIAHVEIQKEEVLAADRLQSKSGKEDLANTIFDLQEEVMQLRMTGRSKSSSSASPRLSHKDEYDYEDEEDPEDIEDPESLNRTLSEIIEGKRSSTSLIAILNRENSDCDSIQSSSSENSASGLRLGHKNLRLDMSDSVEKLSPVSDANSAISTNKGLKVSCSAESGDSEDVSAIDQSKNGHVQETNLTGETPSKVKDNGSVNQSLQTNETGSQSGESSSNLKDNGSVNQSDSGGEGRSTVLLHEQGAMEGSDLKPVCNGEVTDSNRNINIEVNTHK